MMPSTELQLAFDRAYAGTSLNTLGTALTGFSVTSSQLGGMFLEPIAVPRDYDRSRDGRLYITLANVGIVGPATGDVVLQSTRTLAPPPGPSVNVTVEQVFTPPANWDAQNWQQVELLNAGGPWLPAGTIADQSILGIRVARDGGDVLDTWNASLFFADFVRLTYNRLCRFCDGC